MARRVCRIVRCWVAYAVLGMVVAYGSVQAQVEHVQYVHPVYDFLARAAARGTAGDFSTLMLPLQRKEIVAALERIRQQAGGLSTTDKELLEHFEREFGIVPVQRAVVFSSATDSTHIFFSRLLSNDEKYLYRYADSLNTVSVVPLASLEYRSVVHPDSTRSVVLGQAGLRLHGTIDGHIGYYLQVTNGSALSGDRSAALADPRLRRNVKFGALNSDFDFTESHVRVDYGSVYAFIGRETRTMGSGYANNIFLSNQAPPFDAIGVGARFNRFEYRFLHGSLLAHALSASANGAGTVIPSKYLALHRFAYRDTWGEIGFQESVVYSERGADLGYLNPLSFFKSIEHSLHDRDNPVLGLDLTLRPVTGLEVKGSFLLDDLRFEKIGSDYWGNKSAWNIGAMYALPMPIDVAVEYAVVYPYTYTHFNAQNAMTHDGLQFAGSIPPNSDRLSAVVRWWWGERYPLALTISSLRHGRNIYDAAGNLVKNVGGDITQTRRYEDSEDAPFLDGDLEKQLSFTLEGGVELVRGLHIKAWYMLLNSNGVGTQQGRVGVVYEDF